MLDKCTVEGKTYCLVRQHQSEETDDDWCLGCVGRTVTLGRRDYAPNLQIAVTTTVECTTFGSVTLF